MTLSEHDRRVLVELEREFDVADGPSKVRPGRATSSLLIPATALITGGLIAGTALGVVSAVAGFAFAVMAAQAAVASLRIRRLTRAGHLRHRGSTYLGPF